MQFEKLSLLFGQRLVELSRFFLLEESGKVSLDSRPSQDDQEGGIFPPHFQNTRPAVQVLETHQLYQLN